MALALPSAHLTSTPPAQFADLIAEIEAELSEIHPAWKAPAKSRLGPGLGGTRGIEDPELKSRVKYLLQRRKHLYAGHDWEVVIKSIVGPGGEVRLWAMPIVPKTEHTPESLAAAAKAPRSKPKPKLKPKPKRTRTPKAATD